MTNHFIRSIVLLPSETPCMTCGNLYAKCVRRSEHRRLRPNLLTQTADKSSAEFTREKSHQLEYANVSSDTQPPGPFVYIVVLKNK